MTDFKMQPTYSFTHLDEDELTWTISIEQIYPNENVPDVHEWFYKIKLHDRFGNRASHREGFIESVDIPDMKTIAADIIRTESEVLDMLTGNFTGWTLNQD